MIASLMKAYADSKLEERMRFLTSPKLLIIDEVGYLPLDKHGSSLFFQLICRRYEKGSIIITSNKSYSDWGEIFASDSVIASAILDRLLHHSTTINIKGDSYRLKEKLKAGLVNTKGGLIMAEN
jgi:DNA replication protein DnaC